MYFARKRGSTSVMVRVFIPDTSKSGGAGLTGLTSASTNLTIAYIRELDSSSTSYTGANIEAQTTAGTYQAPSTSSKIRIKAVDATSQPGLYELQFHDSSTAFGTGDTSQNIIINIYEVTTTALNIGPNMCLIPLVPWDYQDSVRLGLTALPNAAAEAAGGLYTRGAGAGQIAQQASGQIDVNLSTIKTQAITCAAGVTVLASVGTAATSTAQTGDTYALANGASGFVALMSAISNIAITEGGTAPGVTAASATYTTGTDAGGVANTKTVDGTYDSVADSAGTLDFYYEFTLATGQVAAAAEWVGYITGVVNVVKFYIRNFTNSAWDQQGTITGIAGTTNIPPVEITGFTTEHTGTGGNAGKVRVRFQATGLTACTVKTDRIMVTPLYTPPTNWSLLGITSGGAVSEVVLADTVTAVTDNVNAVLANDVLHGGDNAQMQISATGLTPGLILKGAAPNGIAITDYGSVNDAWNCCIVQPDDKLLAAGYITPDREQATTLPAISRYNTDGTLDQTFGSGGRQIVRFQTGGIPFDEINAITLDSVGRIVIAGLMTTTNNPPFGWVVGRLLADGTPDPAFGTNGITITDFMGDGTNCPANAVAVDSSDRPVVGGEAVVAGFTNFAVARYTTAGVLDPTFGTGGKVTTSLGASQNSGITAIKVLAGGEILAAGNNNSGASDVALAQYTSAGILDGTFGTGGKVTHNFGGVPNNTFAMAIQGDGKIVTVGHIESAGPNTNFLTARFNSDGSLNTAGFNSPDGFATADFGSNTLDTAEGVVIQGDGKVVVGGEGGSPLGFAFVRYNSDGTVDTGFGTAGQEVIIPFGVHAGAGTFGSLALQSDGQILSAGWCYTDSSFFNGPMAAMRLNSSDGSLDTSYGSGGQPLVMRTVGNGIQAVQIVGGTETLGTAAAISVAGDGALIASLTNGSGAVLRGSDGLDDLVLGTYPEAIALLAAVYEAFEHGTAQAGGASTITLRAAAPGGNSYWKDQVVYLYSGTGVGQTNRITAYVAATKVATVETAWITQPDSTTKYIILGRVG